jgi:glycosyltransferase involved in cell wall biosynthesis
VVKLLHCIPGMGGGGAERQLAYLAAPLAHCGWEVHVALSAGGPNLSRLQAGGAAVHTLTAAGNHDPRLAWRLARVFKRVHPDIVQVWFVQMEVLGGIVSELSGTPWIMSERSSAPAYPASMKNRTRVLIARTADAIVANSPAGEAYWHARAPRVPRFVIPNALPFDEIAAASPAVPPNVALRPDDAVVLFAGRFGSEKNVETLVHALAQLVHRPGTSAVLCGDGPLRGRVQQMIAAAGVAGRILTPGYVDPLWPLMKRADVFVSVGLFEGHPNTVLEAMACGRALVVSDIPAHRDLLDEASAFWVDPMDATAIALTLTHVLDHPDEAAARAGAAQSRAARWSIAQAAAAYDRVYRAVLARRWPRTGVT